MANFVHKSTNNFPVNDLDQKTSQVNTPTLPHNRSIKRSLFLKKLLNPKILVSSLVLFLLVIGGASAFFLSQTSQDVRQQASGCTYWNGEAATEGSVDNRGGIRQECKNGLWTVPDDGNLDPSEIIAEQNAKNENKPKKGCVSWDGSEVAHGAVDNRGGIRQQCDNGLWNRPEDGNLDPSEIIAQQNESKPKNGCVSWDGSSVSHGAYEDRGGIRQQCQNGLWDTPDDGITDPRGGIDQISEAIGGLDEGEVDYVDARETYDKFCRNNIESQSVNEVCDTLNDSLRESEQTQRYTALNDIVTSNTDTVSIAIGRLDEGEIDYAEALAVYDNYCDPETAGTNYNYTSSSVCASLQSSLNDNAQTQRYTALDNIVNSNTEVVSTALGQLDEGDINFTEAKSVYDSYCNPDTAGANYNYTSTSECTALESSLQAEAARVGLAFIADFTGDIANRVTYAIEAVQIGIMDLDSAQTTYDEVCALTAAAESNDYCQRLQAAIITKTNVEESCGGIDQDPCEGSEGVLTCDDPLVLNSAGDACIQSTVSATCSATTISKRACERFGDECAQSQNGCWAPIGVQGFTPTECVANSCDDGKWCGSDGKRILSISCGNEVDCEGGRVSDGRCNANGSRCINGVLYNDYRSCSTEEPDPASLVAEEADFTCFEVCRERGASVNQCNEECVGFNADLITSAVGYQTSAQCITAMQINDLSGRCTQRGSRYVFVAAEGDQAGAEYKSCFWWSESTSRCVEDIHYNPDFSDCSQRSSGYGNSCDAVRPEGIEDIPEEIETNQELIAAGINTVTSLWTSYLDRLRNQSTYASYAEVESEVNELYGDLGAESCTCTGSFEQNPVTVNVGVSGTGDDNKCYQCYLTASGGCGWSTSCGYSYVTEVDSDLDMSFAELQIEYPNHLFLVSDLTSSSQVDHVQYTFELLPDSLLNLENNTYMIGEAGSGGGLANQSTNIIYVGSPADAPYTQNPDTQYGYGTSIVIHETLHVLDDTQVEGFCADSGCPTYLEMFVEVAAQDGLVFETEFSDMEVEGSSDFLLYSEYPTNPSEGFAITGAAYVLAGEQLREERPELYEFYRDTVFEGNEYIEVLNSDCQTTRIEIKTEQSESAQQQMNNQCN